MRTAFDLDQFGGRMDLVFTELMHTVRTGCTAWETVFGTPFWDYLAADPATVASFDASMARSTRTAAAIAYDWSGMRHVIDIGGRIGAPHRAAHPLARYTGRTRAGPPVLCRVARRVQTRPKRVVSPLTVFS